MRGKFRMTLAITLATLCVVAASAADKISDMRKLAQADQPASASAQPPEAAAEPSVTILGSRQAQSVLGKEVRSSADENMGRIVDVIVDRAGRVRAAIIDFGGFLGVGSRRIAVDWAALSFAPDSGKRDLITLELTRDQVKAAPEYKDKQAVVVLGAAGALQLEPDW